MTTADPVVLFDLLLDHASHQPDRLAIVTPDLRLSYRELPNRVAALAGWLLDHGFDPDAMTAVTIPDEAEHLLVTLALTCLGTRNISLGTFETPFNRTAIAARLDVTQIVTGSGVMLPDAPQRRFFAPPAASLPDSGLANDGADDGANDWASDSARKRMLATTVARADMIIYRSTSGTTGTPKTFGLSMGFLLDYLPILSRDPAKACVLRTSSVEHDSSRLHQLMALFAGTTSAILDPITANRLGPFCASAGVTEIHAGTYRLASLLAAAPDDAQKLPDGVRILTGSSRVSAALRLAIRTRLTPLLWVNYSTSEAGVISIAGPDDHQEWPEGVGHPVAGAEVILRDADGQPVARGAIGEAWVKKPGLNDWVRTGDLLEWPKDGPLIFHSRIDNMMILNGINIFPGPIEDRLLTHPAVQEAVAYPVPSAVHGQIPVAAVVLRAGAQADPAELLGHVRATLGLRAPRQVRIVEAIPRTWLGKPRPTALREG